MEFVPSGFWPATMGYIDLICSAMAVGSASWFLATGQLFVPKPPKPVTTPANGTAHG